MSKNLPTESEADDYGPAMSACLPKERAFVLALLQGRNGAQAAREAGYGAEDGSSSAETFARIALRTVSRDRVIDALTEQSRKTIRSLAPSAIQAIKEIITTTNHKDRAKVALSMLERVDPIVQRIDVKHQHEVVDRTKAAIEHLARLKAKGANREFLVAEFGELGLAHFETILAQQNQAKPIDAEFTEITDEIPRVEDL